MQFYNLSKLFAISLLAQILVAYFISPWILLILGIGTLIYLIATTHTLAVDEPEQQMQSNAQLEPATQLARVRQ